MYYSKQVTGLVCECLFYVGTNAGKTWKEDAEPAATNIESFLGLNKGHLQGSFLFE